MKKALKFIGISLGSIIAVATIVVCIVVWLVFTPAKLTPIVKNFAPKVLTCQTELDTVDLTFFSTFPRFGIRIHNLDLINPMEGAPSDTVAHIEEFVATVDVKEYLSNNNVIVNGIFLSNSRAHIFVNAKGVANYDIFVSDTSAEDTSSAALFNTMSIDKIGINDFSVTYKDLATQMGAVVKNIILDADVAMEGNDIATDFELSTSAVSFDLSDSTQLNAQLSPLSVTFSGDFENFNRVKGKLDVESKNVHASMGGVQYADSLQIAAVLPLDLTLDSLKIALTDAVIGVNEHKISLSGNAEFANDITMDMRFSTNNIVLNRFLPLVPEYLRKEYLDGINVDGTVQLSGTACGVLNDTLMPLIVADVVYNFGTVAIEGLGHDLYDVSANVHANIDMNTEKNSSLKVISFSAKTGKSSVTASAIIDDLLNTMDMKIIANAHLWLLDLKAEIPEYIFATGWADGVVTAQCDLDALTNVDLNRIKANGNIALTNFDAIYEDSTFVNSKQMMVDFALPSRNNVPQFKQMIDLGIKSSSLNVEMLDFFKTNLAQADVQLGLSDVMDTTKDVALACNFNVGTVNFEMPGDTITARIRNPRGSATMYPKDKKTGYVCLLNCDSLLTKVAQDVDARTGFISLIAKAEYDEKAPDVFQQWNPDVKLNFNQGQFSFTSIETPIKVSKINCELDKNRLKISDSQMIVGDSDFELRGIIKNIASYLNNEDLLKGDLEFVSNYTNVMQLVDLVSGVGDTTTVASDSAVAVTETTDSVAEDNPFMVPLGVDITLTTDIKKALVGNTIIEHAGGGVTIRDGVLVLEEMGFACDAAQMQLTAMYRSDRKNHLYAGLDFHLINISISDLIDMIPDIDTLVPMLKSFSGKGEFHLAAETYLKSNYDPKFSTLRGAAAIKGKDLVVMDTETFDEISKKLLFNRKKTKNVIDSLSVEMTAFRNEIDLYPFVVSMDKYQAVLSGYHNLDMTYNYHISLTKSPLPVRFGLNVLGSADDLKFQVGRCKYRKLYKPKQRGVVDEQVLALKKTISSSLQSGVKNQDVLIKD